MLHAYDLVALLVLSDPERNNDYGETVASISVFLDVSEDGIDSILVHG